jgi:hypothetical protein
MRYFLSLLIVFICVSTSWAKGPGFSFDFSDSLKKNADAVILLDNTVYTRTSKSNLKHEIRYVITILSDRGDNWAEFSLGYDKFSTISNIECTIYDSKGEKVRKIKSSEIRDYSAYDGFSLFSDNRLKYFKALNPTYPYTIDLSYEIDYQGFISIPSWWAIDGYRIGVKDATITIKYPADLIVNYKEKNIGGITRSELTDGNMKSISWKANNIVAIEKEKFSPDFRDQTPMVLFSPKEFSYDKSEGGFENWKLLGDWTYGLLDTNYELTEKTKQELNALKSKYPDRKELVKQIYKYMQSKTRYVSVQLGIGGFKPFSPQMVDEVGYGDCKALSYYTKALLSYVDIPSCYTVIGVHGSKIEFLDFPTIGQMNHAILCVPMEKDTIWLECTSQTAPFNHLFSGSTGRKALLVTAEGGKLVKTTETKENIQKNNAQVKVKLDGAIVCDLSTSNIGSFYDENFSKLQLSDKELKEEILNESSISDIVLISAKVDQQEEIPELSVNKSFSARNFATKSGNRMFVELSPFTGVSKIAAQKSERRNPVYLEEGFAYDDQITLQLPEGGTIEFCPVGKTIESEFGQYQSKIEQVNGQVVFHRTLSINKGSYPKDKYSSFIGFLNSAAEADKCKVIIKI